MKSGPSISTFLKQILTSTSSSLKTIKTRLIIFSLLRNKKPLISSINHKLQALLRNHDHAHDGPMGFTRPIITQEPTYPDLTRLETEGSVVELVKKSKGGEFRLEDDIDHVADLFIKRFHRQILMQKQLSFNRNQEFGPTTF